MSLTPYDPIGNDWLVSDPFRDEFFGGRRSGMGMDLSRAVAPLMSVDMMENDDSYEVMADLPGVSPEDVDISIDGNQLVMKAERKHRSEKNTGTFHRLERSYGSVQRRVQIPQNADIDNASTQFQNGVLSITFPKLEQQPSKARKLMINNNNSQTR